jgi:hypothetical protein
MLKKPGFAVTVTSILLFIYCLLLLRNSPVAYFIFSISPFLILWTAYTIIRFGIFKSKELADDEEWGYCDKNREEIGIL